MSTASVDTERLLHCSVLINIFDRCSSSPLIQLIINVFRPIPHFRVKRPGGAHRLFVRLSSARRSAHKLAISERICFTASRASRPWPWTTSTSWPTRRATNIYCEAGRAGCCAVRDGKAASARAMLSMDAFGWKSFRHDVDDGHAGAQHGTGADGGRGVQDSPLVDWRSASSTFKIRCVQCCSC